MGIWLWWAQDTNARHSVRGGKRKRRARRHSFQLEINSICEKQRSGSNHGWTTALNDRVGGKQKQKMKWEYQCGNRKIILNECGQRDGDMILTRDAASVYSTRDFPQNGFECASQVCCVLWCVSVQWVSECWEAERKWGSEERERSDSQNKTHECSACKCVCVRRVFRFSQRRGDRLCPDPEMLWRTESNLPRFIKYQMLNLVMQGFLI